jgi:hypothetical protein
MIDNKWFCEPDPFREKYCFFYLSTTPKGEKQVIKGWKSGIGNIDGIALHNQSSDENERHIINSLIPEIKAWRRKNIVVITDTEEKLPLLRTMIAPLSIDEINLSTIKTISLEGILKKYFSYRGDADLQAWCHLLKMDAQNNKETELMRIVLQKLIRLIPEEEMP